LFVTRTRPCRLRLKDIQLMSQYRVLSFKPQLRLEWRGHDGQNETEQPDHSASLGDSITSSTRIRFSVHTRSGAAGVAGVPPILFEKLGGMGRDHRTKFAGSNQWAAPTTAGWAAALDSARALPMRLLIMKVQFATSQPPVAASNSRLRRPARESASGWFDLRMRFRFRTPGIVASCGG
jgi:hypothetical protein